MYRCPVGHEATQAIWLLDHDLFPTDGPRCLTCDKPTAEMCEDCGSTEYGELRTCRACALRLDAYCLYNHVQTPRCRQA